MPAPCTQSPARPVLVVHGGAGPAVADDSPDIESRHAGLLQALARGREALQDGGDAVDAVLAAVAYLEDGVEAFNAGRGSVLCADGSVEMSAAVMRGSDRAAGAVVAVRRARQPVLAARAVMDHSPHVMLFGPAADDLAAAGGLELCDPEYFVTERQRRRLREVGSDFERGTVGAVCLDGGGQLASATSTGGRRGQVPGRIGDTPVIGAGTWADSEVAVSCTGDGEEFIRAGAAGRLALGAAAGGRTLEQVAIDVLGDIGTLGGRGGVITVDRLGEVAMPFTSPAMSRGLWRSGQDPAAWV